MKRFACFLLTVYLLLMTWPLKVYGQKLSAVTGDPLKEDVYLRLDNGTVDDHLIQLAREGNVNFIADATRFPAEPDNLAVESHGALGNLMLEMAQQRRLTWTKADTGTFLFWADWQGDLTELATAILAQEKTRADKMRNPQAATLANDFFAQQKSLEQDILPGLSRYLQEQQGWDGHKPDIAVKVKFADLPPELRAKVMARCQDELLSPQQLTLNSTFFDDAFWDKALLKDNGLSGGVPGWLGKMHNAQYAKNARRLSLHGSGSLNVPIGWTLGWFNK